jgi:molybdopterin-containing oxidoreductase family iron-sulfur binding subunit
MIRRGGKLVQTTWDEALKVFGEKISESRSNAANAVFINRHESGNFPAFLNGWLSTIGVPAAISIDPDADYAAIAANRQSYGVSWPKLDFGAAKLIISFGADFLDGWGATVPQQLDFAEARAKGVNAPRLVYVGARRSLTGLNADQWIAVRPGGELSVANFLAGSLPAAQAAQESGVDAGTLTALQAEIGAKSPVMILAGGNSPSGMDLCTVANSPGSRSIRSKASNRRRSFGLPRSACRRAVFQC